MMVSGEKGLIFEVLRQAIVDAHPPKLTYTPRQLRLQQSATQFIQSPAFNQCCVYIGGNARAIKAEIERGAVGVVDRLSCHRSPIAICGDA